MTSFISADFHTQMALGWQVLADVTSSRSNRNEYEAKHADELHQLMGYRAEHADELAF